MKKLLHGFCFACLTMFDFHAHGSGTTGITYAVKNEWISDHEIKLLIMTYVPRDIRLYALENANGDPLYSSARF